MKDIFLQDISLIDVRSEGEFNQGSFPGTVNIPILDNEQRHLVGLTYKQEGQEKAMVLGHQLVSGTDKENKIKAWIGHLRKHPKAILFCFRGGLRSQISQKWISEKNISVPIIEGGQKRLRNFLLDYLQSEVEKFPFLVISGFTGSRKTKVLHNLKQYYRVLDLELAANHRGSAFGAVFESVQPTQIDFENQLAVQLIKNEWINSKYILVEDESNSIGRVVVPQYITKKKNLAQHFILDVPLDQRVKNIREEYVENLWESMKIKDQELFFNFFASSLDKIEKKFGLDQKKCCLAEIRTAIEYQVEMDSYEKHDLWIARLLTYYYDPLYLKSLKKKEHLVAGRGDERGLKEFLKLVF